MTILLSRICMLVCRPGAPRFPSVRRTENLGVFPVDEVAVDQDFGSMPVAVQRSSSIVCRSRLSLNRRPNAVLDPNVLAMLLTLSRNAIFLQYALNL
jgi:hypothetical protein